MSNSLRETEPLYNELRPGQDPRVELIRRELALSAEDVQRLRDERRIGVTIIGLPPAENPNAPIVINHTGILHFTNSGAYLITRNGVAHLAPLEMFQARPLGPNQDIRTVCVRNGDLGAALRFCGCVDGPNGRKLTDLRPEDERKLTDLKIPARLLKLVAPTTTDPTGTEQSPSRDSGVRRWPYRIFGK